MSETMGLITQLISSLGFPIVMVGVVLYLFYDNQKWARDNTLKWQEALSNNTQAMLKLVASIEKEVDIDA